MMTEAKSILRAAKLLEYSILEYTIYCAVILMLGFRRAGKVNF